MAKTMTPSVTDEQIDKAVAALRAALQKKRHEFLSEPVQLALGTDNLGMRLLAPFRELVEMHSNIIVRRVLVPVRSFQAALDATSRKQYTTKEVVDGVPDETEGGERDVLFVKPPANWYKNGLLTCQKVDEFLDLMGLEPDPHGVAAVNEADQAFADEHPHGTQWKNARGEYCYATFGHWNGERDVRVRRDDSGWDDYWLLAGRRKSA